MSEINVKDIILKRIDSKSAAQFVKKHHYSGKIVNNSQLHFGAFYKDILHGVLSYGASMDQKRVAGIVNNTGINEFTELNRMAFDDYLPKNSESRCISVSIRLIKKYCPHIKWIISYADGTQCGDGTIYRACGFLLTSIKKNTTILKLPTGQIVADKTLNNNFIDGKCGSSYWKKNGAKAIEGNQLRYIYFIDKDKIKDLTVPILDYSEIDKKNARMYKGQKYAVLV